MELHGQHLIGRSTSAERPGVFHAVDAKTGDNLRPACAEATGGEIDAALRLAASAATPFRLLPPGRRADFLEKIADGIEGLGGALLERAGFETALPPARLQSERGRTTGQLRAYAAQVREGSWVDARIDRAIPDREPLPKPDVRSCLQPVGPAVVFGASNFPIAISVAGADTAAALGAGCPVVVKAHPAHPGTCEMVGRAILAAAGECGMPEGVFSLVHGAGHEVGRLLVGHPETKVVAFTGGLAGGRALADIAAARPEPVPFYGELGSVNPVFLLPGALAERAEGIAEGFVGSLNMGVGQFCTNPGLVLGMAGEDLDRFRGAAAAGVAGTAPAHMLHPGIRSAYVSGRAGLAAVEGVETAAEGLPGEGMAVAALYEAEAATLLSSPALHEEVFGPASTLVRCAEPAQMVAFAEQLAGSLTASIHGSEEDLKTHADLVATLEEKVGRLIFNGFPTGIEVCDSMHHGGPYPATTHAHFTSIGSRTIFKFTRPVCYQGFPDAALPPALQDDNPLGIRRMVDGVTG